MNQDRGSTLIAIATFRRPDLLSELLNSLADSVGPKDRIVVVDNDPNHSAASVAARFEHVVYVTESTPGIVAARNRALGERHGEEFLAFVDDDEWVSHDWLQRLHDAMTEFSADVVVGPVVPVFSEDAPRWATDGLYFRRKRYRTGEEIRDAPTNNTLVRWSAVQRLETIRFDEAFSETGGSDTEFFSRVSAAGARIVWCDEAEVWEFVPESRISWSWVKQRQVRLGNVKGRLARRRGSVFRVVALGVAYLGYGVVYGTLAALTGRDRSWPRMIGWRGRGILGSLRGSLVREYKRID